MKNHRRLSLTAALAMTLLGCAVFGGGPASSTEAPDSEQDEVVAEPSATATEAFDEVILPVPLNEGLASLDSYRMTYINDGYDSQADQRSVITLVVARDSATDASYSSNESKITTEDYEVTEQTSVEQYIIGNEMCILHDGTAQFTAMSGMARQSMDMYSQTLTITPIIEDPEYVEDDVVHGVPVHTYAFEVRAVDLPEDAEEGTAIGHYSIAIDGHYLVDYRLDMELRTGPADDPSAEYTVSFFDIQIEDINESGNIVFPASCSQAGPAIPNPFGQ